MPLGGEALGAKKFFYDVDGTNGRITSGERGAVRVEVFWPEMTGG